MERTEELAVQRLPEADLGSDPPVEPFEDALPIRALGRGCQTEEFTGGEAQEQFLVGRRCRVMELIDDHNLEVVWLDLVVELGERLDRGEDVLPLVGTMPIDV
jgi:hypothetical protein